MNRTLLERQQHAYASGLMRRTGSNRDARRDELEPPSAPLLEDIG